MTPSRASVKAKLNDIFAAPSDCVFLEEDEAEARKCRDLRFFEVDFGSICDTSDGMESV